ncbi:MAG: DUF3631 domain-containing protein [Erysipelotrichia bacterium]|nr:DUF3631 domain-containing protein [Erysipelotrichia bacterium]
MIQPLNNAEERRVETLISSKKAELRHQAKKIRYVKIEKDAAQYPEHERAQIRARLWQAYENSELEGDFPVVAVVNGVETELTVQDLLDSTELYHHKRALNLTDHNYNNREPVCVINTLSDPPNIYSYHEGVCYKLIKSNAYGIPADELRKLESMTDSEYELHRNELSKKLGIRRSHLDNIRAHFKKKNSIIKEPELLLSDWEVNPWPEKVNLDVLLNQIFAILCKFVIADVSLLHVASVWAVLTWFVEDASVLPRLIITAPEKGCGKTIFLSTVGKICRRPLQSSSISSASFFRVIEEFAPTLLIDEADTIAKDDEQLRALLNAGHTRDSAQILRVEESDGKRVVKIFNAFAPVALAGIKLEKKLAGTVLSRGIRATLRKKKRGEKTDNLRHSDKMQFKEIREKACRSALDNGYLFGKACPDMEGLENRDADNWEPLVAIAEMASPEWRSRIMKAALALSDDQSSDSREMQLLRAIKKVFDSTQKAEISTNDLISELCRDETAPWASFYRGAPINSRQIADRLSSYNIAPVQLGKKDGLGKNLRGYRLAQFTDAFERYLSELNEKAGDDKASDDNAPDNQPEDGPSDDIFGPDPDDAWI